MKIGIVYIRFGKVRQGWIRFNDSFCCFTILLPPRVLIIKLIVTKTKQSLRNKPSSLLNTGTIIYLQL